MALEHNRPVNAIIPLKARAETAVRAYDEITQTLQGLPQYQEARLAHDQLGDRRQMIVFKGRGNEIWRVGHMDESYTQSLTLIRSNDDSKESEVVVISAKQIGELKEDGSNTFGYRKHTPKVSGAIMNYEDTALAMEKITEIKTDLIESSRRR